MKAPTSCKKIVFESRAAAKKWAREAKRSGAYTMRVYVCEECTEARAWDEVWHLTSGPKTGRAKGGKRNGKNSKGTKI